MGEELALPVGADPQPIAPEAPAPDATAVSSAETVGEGGRFQRLIAATRQLGHMALRGGQAALALLEVSPANEAVRLSAWGSAEAIAHSPVIGALSYGLATLGVESLGAVAGASLLNTASSKRFAEFLNKRLPRSGTNSGQVEFAKTTKVFTAVAGGSVAAMALKKLEDPERTTGQDRRFGLWTSAWLAGACAVQGALMSEGVNVGLDHPVPAAAAVGTVTAAAGGRWLRRRLRARSERPAAGEAMRDVDSESGMVFELVTDNSKLETAAKLERDVWQEKDYGELEQYADHIAQARTFATFKGDTCVGMLRMFGGETALPPFTELPIDNDSDERQIAEECQQGLLEEVGTLAVRPEYRGGAVIAARLQRLAYRDARARGIKTWGIIMEPERVQKMNERYGFTFRQLGPTVHYQGGDCAAHIMDLEEVDRTMRQKFPEIHRWFVDEPLGE